MSKVRSALLAFVAMGVLLFGGCASLQHRQPLQVGLVGVEPLPGEGLEWRMLVKVRIQNPNDTPVDFNGVSLEMNVQGKRFATGVSDEGGSVPRFGETVIAVPVSMSAFRMASGVFGLLATDYRGKLAYEMTGRLAGPAFNSVSFQSTGEFTLPEQIFHGGQ